MTLTAALIVLALSAVLIGVLLVAGMRHRLERVERRLMIAEQRQEQTQQRSDLLALRLQRLNDKLDRAVAGMRDAPADQADDVAASTDTAPKTTPEPIHQPATPAPPDPVKTLAALREAKQAAHAPDKPRSIPGPQEPAEAASITPKPSPQTRRPMGFEELLAGKVFVWIGAVALVLTAAFLLKLGFDKGIITEPVRVLGAAGFGLVLCGVGEWMRTRSRMIAQSLCGAAVAVLFGSVLAGHNLYHLIGGGTAFTCVAFITAGAVGGSGLALGLIYLDLVPAGLCWLWARRRERLGEQQHADALRVVAVILAGVFTGLQVRNAFHAGGLRTPTIGMYECSAYAVAWMLLGGLFMLLSPQLRGQRLLLHAGRAIFGVGLSVALIGNALVLNPLWTDASVGTTPVFNGLWLLFGPAILGLAALAHALRRHDRAALAHPAGYAAIALVFVLASLLVRQGFSADGVLVLDATPIVRERYAYSLAWVLLGGALLAAGLLSKLNTLRYGSLAVMLVAVAKVFLIDTASLDNLYRVFSFFGLGVTLIALGYVYQRFVFGPAHLLRKGAQPA